MNVNLAALTAPIRYAATKIAARGRLKLNWISAEARPS
jgi:hypothetical protein